MHSGMGEGGERLNPPRLGGGENIMIGIGGTREKKVIIYLVVVEHFSPIFCISTIFFQLVRRLFQGSWSKGTGRAVLGFLWSGAKRAFFRFEVMNHSLESLEFIQNVSLEVSPKLGLGSNQFIVRSTQNTCGGMFILHAKPN